MVWILGVDRSLPLGSTLVDRSIGRFAASQA
jgi:hypothetical protein